MKNIKRYNFLLVFIVGFLAFIVGLGGMIGIISNFDKESEDQVKNREEKEVSSEYVADKTSEIIDMAEKAESAAEVEEKEVVENEDRKVVQFDSPLTEQEIRRIELEYDVAFVETESKRPTNNPVYTLNISKNTDLNQLKSESKVNTLETDIPVRIFAQSVDWGVERIGATNIWDVSTGSGVIIAVIDTGVQLDHPDLSGNIVDGYDFVNEDSSAYDDHGHGTHVAGIVSAVNNGYGSVGSSYSAKIMPIKALNSQGTGYLSDIVEGIYYAVDNGADVINMSLGTTYDSSVMRQAVRYASSNNVLVIAAAGNSSASSCAYPAGYSEVVCVMATDSENRLASFSNKGGEISAPGVSNYSTYLGNKYAYLSGTSMASPHVAGAAAVIMQSGVSSASDVRDLLNSTAVDLGETGNDTIFGYGLIDLVQAVDPIEETSEEELVDEPEEETNPETGDEDSEDNLDQREKDKQPRSPADNNNENAADPGVIMQRLTIYEPEDRRVRIEDEEIEEVKFEFSVEPVISNSKLDRMVITLNNKEIYSTTEQEGEFEWDVSDLQNGQYVLHFIAYYDKGQQHERVLIEIRVDERARNRVSDNRNNKSVKGVTDIKKFDENFWVWLYDFIAE